jgi:RNA polymerase sigma factor (sigma-70 family)
LRTEGLEAEVLQQTLVEIWESLHRGAGPAEPAAFLKWSRVILFRQAGHFLDRSRSTLSLSLEAQPEGELEALLDAHQPDPLEVFLEEERQQELQQAIGTLKNPHYQQVLLSTCFVGLEESELAARWKVRPQDIYLWRFRAIQALRKQEALVQRFRQYA